MLSLVHVVEWRAAVQPDQVALSDDRGTELTYASLANLVYALFTGVHAGRDRRVS
jgi:hypothetical protein